MSQAFEFAARKTEFFQAFLGMFTNLFHNFKLFRRKFRRELLEITVRRRTRFGILFGGCFAINGLSLQPAVQVHTMVHCNPGAKTICRCLRLVFHQFKRGFSVRQVHRTLRQMIVPMTFATFVSQR